MGQNETWRQIYKPDDTTMMVLIEQEEVSDPLKSVETLEQKVERLETELNALKEAL